MIRVYFEEGEKGATGATGATGKDGQTPTFKQDQQWTLDRSIRKLGGTYNGSKTD